MKRVRAWIVVAAVAAALPYGASSAAFAQRWEDLSPDEQSEAWKNFDAYHRLAPERRQGVDQRYERWKKLPSDEKNRLRHRYRELEHDGRGR